MIGTVESTRDVAGSILNTWVANSRMRMMPITNSGSAASARLPTVTLTSNLLSLRNAVREPRSSETGTLTRAAMNTRMKELSDAPADEPGDRRVLRERVAEVAGDHAAEPAEVLRRHGLVEPELLLERLVPVLVGRLPAEDRFGGVARESLRRDEDDHRHQEQRQHAEADPDEDQLQKRRHERRLPLAVLLIMMAASRAGTTEKTGSRGRRDRRRRSSGRSGGSGPRVRGHAPYPRPPAALAIRP